MARARVFFVEPAIHVDETFVKEKRAPGCEKANGKLKQCYLWFICARADKVAHQTLSPLQPVKGVARPDQSLIYMEYTANRNHEHASIIGDYSGLVHSDCFEAYEKLAEKGQFNWQACLTHAARKFAEAPATPMNNSIVRKMKKIIKEDYKLLAVDLNERAIKRTQEIKPLFDTMAEYLKGNEELTAVQICEKTNNVLVQRKSDK